MNQPDIIFIVLDTQRADRLGCYGYQRPLTPNLDRFAAQSTLFEQAISPAQWTVPSHAAMFTGLYPTAHQLLQAHQSLPTDRLHLAEILKQTGYETVGFCNNPLVGILNNGLKRGFDTFYNYGGAFPSMPGHSSPLPWPLNQAVEGYTQFLRRISYPIQNFFGQSDLAFRISLNAWLTPLWSKLANFKGQNQRSVKDLSHWLRQREAQTSGKPLFLFLNLMETHLPFWPPGEFVDQVAPYFRESKEAREVMRRWNREAYRWAAPLAAPLTELESRVLSDMYDAEVAYQDAYLGELFDVLNGRANQQNTLTIIVADHGDGLGEHGYMGHAFVAYQELVHVPLIMNWPKRLSEPGRIDTPVSTRRVFHTILDAAGRLPELPGLEPASVHGLTLLESAYGRDPDNGAAYTEIYPPQTFVKAIEKRQPELLLPYRCLSTRRAVVRQAGVEAASTYKLIHVDDQPDELFDLAVDGGEVENVMAARPSTTCTLNDDIRRIAANVTCQRDHLGTAVEVEIDDNLAQRLRALGYID
ncbi:MAG: sulfatase [Chloroflexi bacterium]|nr:sulfatase [Ardenticatenaceae bacterium]MBL1128830.1 sulfatase [Chloroflexota bacterium]NOG34908.1 sulfatase [Chloroflexota bacterium]GIK58071.1 MAG: sulfatase [Chloroflexota bacterium]